MPSKELPKELAQIHKILGRAMREVAPILWPPRPHLGGPLPVLSTATQLSIGVAICDEMRGIADASLLPDYDLRAALAHRIDDGTTIPAKEIDRISQGKKSDPPALKIAKLTLRAAYNHLYASMSARNVVGMCVENAAIVGVQYYTGDDEAVRTFLGFVDQAVMRCELRTELKERAFEPSSEIAQVVSRPKGKTKGLALVLARLADNSYGLFVKLKQRWQWHEGDRDTMFATVPDEFMRLVAADIDPGFKRTQA